MMEFEVRQHDGTWLLTMKLVKAQKLQVRARRAEQCGSANNPGARLGRRLEGRALLSSTRAGRSFGLGGAVTKIESSDSPRGRWRSTGDSTSNNAIGWSPGNVTGRTR